MAICNFNENEQTFVVNLISSLSTDCSTTYQYEIISENGEEVNITLIGNHSNTIYISNGVEYPFIDNVTVFFRNSLIVTFSLLNSGVGGYFNKTTLAIINNDTLSPVNAIYNTQTRLNDEPICGSGGVTGPESYVSDVAVVGNDLVFTGLEDAFNSTISLPSPITRKTYSHSVQKFDAGQGPIDLWLSMKTLTTSTEIFNNSTGEADLINVVASDIYTSSMIAPKDCYLSNIQFQGNTGTAIGIGLVMLYDGVTTIVFENNAIVQENNFSFDYDFATTLIIPQDAILYFFIKPSSTGLYGSFQFHITETNGSIFSETPSSGINLTTSGVSGPATLLGNILNIPVYTGGAGGTGVVETIVPGTNITVDDTDPANPIISSSGGGVTDHTLLTNIGTNTHTQIDSHIIDSTIHFVENPNWNTAFGWGDHAGLYLPIATQLAQTKVLATDEYFTSYDATTGLFTTAVVTGGAGEINTINSIITGEPVGSDVIENIVSLTQEEYDLGPIDPTTTYVITNATTSGGVTDHTLLTNIGTNTHVQIDSHIADATIHFTQASISITESQISDLGPYNNYVHPTGDGNLHVPANSTTNNGKVLTSGATAGVYTWETIPAGVTDHTLLSNIGTNTHAQIDTHIADTTIHFTQAEISITESQISDLTHFAPTNLLTDYGFTDNSVTWNALVTFPGFGTLSGDYGYAEPTHALADLTDVDATVASPTDGKILVYRSAGTDWVLEDKPIPGGGGATQLNELSDVTNVTYTNRHVLVADGVDYDSRALVEADISDLGTYLTTLAFAGLSDYPTDAIGSLTNDGAGNLTWSASGSSLPVVDTTAVVKGSVDATKLLRFEVDGISTSTTRIINQPDYNVNLNDVYYIDGGDANVNISEGGVSPTYGDSIPEEEQISGTRLTNATVIGSTALDWSAYKTFEFTLTGITTLTDSNLPAGTNTKVIELIITGDFALTLPTYWEALPSNDNYVGTVRNHLVVSCINGTTSSEDVIYSLQNLTT